MRASRRPSETRKPPPNWFRPAAAQSRWSCTWPSSRWRRPSSFSAATSRAADSGSFRRAGQQEPVHAEVARRFLELVEINRLDDVAVHAQPVTLDQVPLLPRGSQHHDRDGPGAFVRLDTAEHLQAIDQRQLDVEQDDVRVISNRSVLVAAGTEHVFEGFLAVAYHMDLVGQLILAQFVKRELLVLWIVLDHEDVYAAVGNF